MTLAPAHNPLPRGHRLDSVGHDVVLHDRPRKQSTAPPGLFAPAPEVVREKMPKPRPSRARPADLHKPRKVAKCGTPTGYDRHRRLGEDVCEPCKESRRAQQRAYEARKREGKPKVERQRPPCGTPAAYAYHRRYKETVCDLCRVVENERQAAYRRARGERPMTPRRLAQCGDPNGARAHRRRGEKVCDLCVQSERAAEKARNRDRRKTQVDGAA